MKLIELTEEHKNKLLEMCKVLFPEYKYWELHDGTCDLCMENTLDYSIEESPKWNSWNRIYWFEFCMTHLFEKIYVKPNGYESISDYISINSNFIIGHPIDYLYEEFKKIKINLK